MTEHTPTPWQVTEHDNGLVVRTTDLAGRPIASLWLNGESPQANAAFIVKAVNNHDAVVAALVRAREAVNAIVLSTRSISFDADLRAIDTALAGAGITSDVGGARE